MDSRGSSVDLDWGAASGSLHPADQQTEDSGAPDQAPVSLPVDESTPAGSPAVAVGKAASAISSYMEGDISAQSMPQVRRVT